VHFITRNVAVVPLDPSKLFIPILRSIFTWQFLGLFLVVVLLLLLNRLLDRFFLNAPSRDSRASAMRGFAPGVYVIHFRTSGAVYIGASFNFGGRVRRHWSKLNARCHPNLGLDSEFARQGGTDIEWTFRPMPGATAQQLCAAEQELLAYWLRRVGRSKVLNEDLNPKPIRRMWRSG